MKRTIIKQIEEMLRQQVEEKPYLLFPAKEQQLYTGVKRRLGMQNHHDELTVAYVKDWAAGFRLRKLRDI